MPPSEREAGHLMRRSPGKPPDADLGDVFPGPTSSMFMCCPPFADMTAADETPAPAPSRTARPRHGLPVWHAGPGPVIREK